MVLKNFSEGKPPDPHISSAPLPQQLSIAKVKLTRPQLKKFEDLFLVLPLCIGKSENAFSGMKSKWDKCLSGVSQMR